MWVLYVSKGIRLNNRRSFGSPPIMVSKFDVSQNFVCAHTPTYDLLCYNEIHSRTSKHFRDPSRVFLIYTFIVHKGKLFWRL